MSVVFGSTPASAHNLINVGRTAAGQLSTHTHIDQPFPMPESVFGPTIPGYATASVGVASIFTDDPKEGLFTLSPQADIQMIVVAADANLFLYNDTGSGVLSVGGTWHCGPHVFHVHPLWQINPGVPGATYTISIRLHDLSGTHADSEVFNIEFAPKCNGDVTVDGTIDIDDLVALITSWGSCDDCACDADLNMDCNIDIDDLVALITHWGICR
jgi:hypothetical protein